VIFTPLLFSLCLLSVCFSLCVPSVGVFGSKDLYLSVWI
jgi:hypothetical protein